MTKADMIDDFPLSDPRSFGLHAAKLGVGLGDIAFPGFGYLLQLGVDKLAGDPLQERRVRWLVSVGEGLRELQGRFEGFDPSALNENEEFLSAVYDATEASMKTHKEFKREALKNTVLNAAVNFTIDDALRGRFMSCIDHFTEKHVRILNVLHDPSRFPACADMASRMMGAQMHIIRAEIPDSEIDETVFSIIIDDLSRERMIEGSLNTMVSGSSLLVKRSTPVGDAFLRFIRAPEPI